MVLEGKKCDQEKDEFNKQPHGTWPHTLGSSYLELLHPSLARQWFSLQTLWI